MKLTEIVAYLDAELRTAEIQDYPNAHNGLQLENGDSVTRVACAVDACEAVIDAACEARADLLIVHHGLLWAGAQRIEGAHYRKLKRAIDAGLAIYSSHLPLDRHPRLGNNALLAKALGVGKTASFLEIGVEARVNLTLSVLIDRVERAVGGPAHLAPGGPERVRRLGIVTGGAGGEIAKAADAGVDTFLTGEGPHWSYTAAEELGVNLIYAGHYATETFGVKALGAELEKKFGLPWVFVDHPSGL
ncbi:MAG: Nif3-like dinuclear metal center hexameric protein [Terrimicrobiaceae bacterium]|nr:Nif3-like dinuclear metal center hexameric protein [Terrimicrobiaceae bacterium]